jgi:branched-chain amino acid transport system substrate-binding protein
MDISISLFSGNADMNSGADHRRRYNSISAPIHFLLFIFLLLAGICQAQPPDCSDSSVKLGMSTALTGNAAHLGANMRTGVLVALDEYNEKQRTGGVTFCLKAKDDGYEPAITLPNMLALIDEENVLAIIGNVGTPTAIAAIPVANRLHVPFIGAFSGAGVLRKNPPDRFVINYRASYAEETAVMVEALINKGGLKPSEIAFFTQRDAYGDAGFAGGIAALKKHGLGHENEILHGRYERNTLAVENGLATILLAPVPPKAVIMVAAYAPCARFIRLARQHGLDALFLNVSFVGAVPLAAELGDTGENVIITEVVPHFENDLPISREFRHAMERFAPESHLTFGAMEGYIVTRIFLLAVSNINGPLTGASVINAMENLGQFDLGLGIKLCLGPDEHQASHQVWPTIIRNRRVVVFGWEELPDLLQ